MRLLITVFVGLAFSIAACSEESSGPDSGAPVTSSPGAEPTQSPGPSAEPSAEPDCLNEQAVTSDPDAMQTETSEGDIDGDGIVDTVMLAVDSQAPPGCQAFLVAETSSGRLVEEIGDPELSTDLGFPAIEGVIPVDGGPGAEVVVRVTAGASTTFSGLFTVYEGALTRVRVPRGNINGDLFASGGSVGHIEGADCDGGNVVVSLAVPAGKGYEVARTWFRFSGAELVPADKERNRIGAEDLDQFPEFAGPLFARCG